jgi:hypothetical protein
MREHIAPTGFALPTALVVIALASFFAITGVTMVLAAGRIASGDARAQQAYEVAQAGLADAREHLRWDWSGALTGERTTFGDDGWYQTRATVFPSPSDLRPHLLLTSAGHSASATKLLTTEVALEATGLPAGLTVAGDIEARAAVTLVGSGVYANGDVVGRQLITFVAADGLASPASPDWADGARFPIAAVHATGAIFDDAGEEHDPGRRTEAASADTDRHTPMAARPTQWAPDEITLTSLSTHALPESSVLHDGVVDVGRLPLQPPADDATLPGAGLVVVVSASGSDEGVRLVGSRPEPPVACPLTVVVIGDATTAAPPQGSAPTTWWGALIVTGGLVVASPLDLHGSLFARHLTAVAPLNLELEEFWWREPPPGYRRTVVIARDW